MIETFDGKAILVTGGTGSFGLAFIGRVLEASSPARLVIYSRDEQKQFDMAQRFSPREHPCLRYFIGDVRDAQRLKMAMRDVDIIIHAAALKHVPVAEYNPIEAINTNIIGAENVINAAIETGVKKVIALSTDKAANPINLYGATKLCADKLFVAANNLSGGGPPDFSVARYGNVLGSRGSVIPYFRKLIDEGAESLPITDPRMTRFWITLPQGVDFVARCLDDMEGGEIFVPKIPSMKVMDIAAAMAPDLLTHVIGIRPGEKLHEVLITSDDAINTLEFDDCYVIRPTWVPKLKGTEFHVNGRPGSPVPEDFEYRSDKNDEWLSAEGLHEMLKSMGTTA